MTRRQEMASTGGLTAQSTKAGGWKRSSTDWGGCYMGMATSTTDGRRTRDDTGSGSSCGKAETYM